MKQRFHKRAQHALHKFHDSEFHKYPAQGAGEHANAHKIEHCVEQKVVGCVHQGVEHVGHTHLLPQIVEKAEHHYEAYYAFISAQNRFLCFFSRSILCFGRTDNGCFVFVYFHIVAGKVIC